MRTITAVTALLGCGLLACDDDGVTKPTEQAGECEANGTCPPCTDGDYDREGQVCADGEWTTCEALAGAHCDFCACPTDKPYCEPATKQCVALKQTGEACGAQEECASGRCGAAFDGSSAGDICRAALGEPCDEATCKLCMSDGTGSYCGEDCAADNKPSIVEAAGTTFYCITNQDTDESRYRRACEEGSCALTNEECTGAAAASMTVYYCNPVEDTSRIVDLPFSPSNLAAVQGAALGALKDIHLCPTCVCSRLELDTDLGSVEVDCDPYVSLPFQIIQQEGVSGASAELGVFLVRTLDIEQGSVVRIRGSRPLALVAQNRLDVDVELIALGGYPSGVDNGPAQGPGVGLNIPEPFVGGGGEGGSYCSNGASGAAVPGQDGSTYGTPELVPLTAGSAGASIDFSDENYGAGGGAIQLVAGKSLHIGPNGAILARGRTGDIHDCNFDECGNGGGSGGAILLEAPVVVIAGRLDAGGGAGAGDSFGGAGATGSSWAESGRTDDSVFGGGGGGFGRIRINTSEASAVLTGSQLSPSAQVGECFTQGQLTTE